MAFDVLFKAYIQCRSTVIWPRTAPLRKGKKTSSKQRWAKFRRSDPPIPTPIFHTDKKETKVFLIEIRIGSCANSYMRKGILICEEMRIYFTIYEEAVSHI